jgi:hypothetical protein
MSQMPNERTAAVLVALTGHPSGLRLADLARATAAPLSSTQRVVEALFEEGVVVRDGASRPRYRVALEAPVDALATLAAWRLPPGRAAQIRQRMAALDGEPKGLDTDLEERLRDAMNEPEAAAAITDLAERLVWWQPATRTLRHPERLIAQAMAVGASVDADRVETLFGIEAMRQVLAAAPAGIFDRRRWDYWHLRFGYGRTPPLPARSA